MVSHLAPVMLGSLIANAVLTAVLLYVRTIPQMRPGLGWWAACFGLNALRMAIYAGSPALNRDLASFAAEYFQAVQSVLLLGGTLVFLGREIPTRVVAAVCVAAAAWTAVGTFVFHSFLMTTIPLYLGTGAALIWSGILILKGWDYGRKVGRTITGVAFILWGLHKLNFPFLRTDPWYAPWHFTIALALTMTTAVGIIVLALRTLQRRTEREAAERLEAQRALLASEARFRTLVENASVFCVVLDTTGRVAYCNAHLLQVTGWSEEDVVGRDYFDRFIPEEDRETYRNVLLKTLRDRALPLRPHHENPIVTRSGERRLVVWSSAVLTDAAGNASGAISVGLDQTERVSAFAEINRKNAIINALTEHLPSSATVKDLEGRFTLVNRTFAKRWGLEPDKIVGKTSYDIEPREIADDVTRLDRIVMETLEPAQESFTHVDSRGRQSIHLALKFPLFDADGNLFGIGGVATDITELKQAEKALRESEARLRSLIDAVPLGIVLKDLDGRFQVVNRTLRKWNGWFDEDLRGKTSYDLHPKEIADLASQQEREALESGGPLAFERDRLYGDGVRRQLTAVRFPVFAADRTVIGTGAVMIDVSAEKRAERALRESEELYHTAFRISPDAVGLSRLADGLYVDVNEGFTEMTGFAREDVIGKTAVEIGVWDELGDRERLAEGVREHGQVLNLKAVFRRKDGSTITGLMSARALTVKDVPHLLWMVRDISGLQRAEEALRKSEAQLRSVVDAAPVAIVLKDFEGHFQLANKAFLAWHKLSAADLSGKTGYDLYAKKFADAITRRDRATWKGKVPPPFEMEHAFPDGIRRHVSVVRFPVFEAEGAMVGTGAIVTDVSGEKLAELALRDSEKKLRVLMESTGEGIYAVDLKGRCTLCNPAAARILGYDDPSDLLGSDIHEMMHHSHVDGSPYPKEECKVHQAAALGVPMLSGDDVFWRREGQPIAVEFLSNPAIENDKVVGAVVIFSDISERKKVEAWLLRLSQCVEQSPLGVVVTDADGKVEYVNSSFTRETGYESADLRGKPVAILNADGEGGPLDREVSERISSGRPWSGEIRKRRRNGEAYWAWLSISPIQDKNGRVVAYVRISENVTERRKEAEHLRQAHKMEALGQLTGGIAHDFNNILSVIQLNAEVLADDLLAGAACRGPVATIVRSVHRAAELTERLLAFSRRQDLSPDIVDLGSAVREMVDMLVRSLGETIAIAVHVEDDVPAVAVDRGQFENALLNLAVNARDAMPGGGSLTIVIGCSQPPANDLSDDIEFVRVSVADSGIGMPPEVAERIFEPFFTTKGKGQGTGLGLAMVYGFVKQSGGDIVVDSVEGQGTTFHLYFPAAKRAALNVAEVAAESSDDKLRSMPPLIVLLAEDDESVRSAAGMILSGSGHTVIQAASGVKALKLLKRTPNVDLLLTDVVMPGGMSGRDLADAARQLCPGLKILFTSGYANGLLSVKDMELGVSAFLPKPYTKEGLVGAIRSLWFSRPEKGPP